LTHSSNELDTLLELAIDFAADPDSAVLATALAEARRLTQDEAPANIQLGQTRTGNQLQPSRCDYPHYNVSINYRTQRPSAGYETAFMLHFRRRDTIER